MRRRQANRHAYKLLYQNEEAETCVTYLKPTQGFIVYADDLLKAPMFAVLYNKMAKDELTATVYPQNSTETFILHKTRLLNDWKLERTNRFSESLVLFIRWKRGNRNPMREVRYD